VQLGDVFVGDEAVPVWMAAAQYEYWRHTHLTIDVVKGRGSGFSLEAPEGVPFPAAHGRGMGRRVTQLT
jgi:uncharacterized protein (DUF779 family)